MRNPKAAALWLLILVLLSGCSGAAASSAVGADVRITARRGQGCLLEECP